MAVTNPDVSAYQGMSMFLVPTDTPGVEHRPQRRPVRRARKRGSHALIHYEDVRVPAEACSAARGKPSSSPRPASGGGRIHHAMRTIGLAQKAIDMMCERVLSRETAGSLLAESTVQGYIADSYAQLSSSGCSCCTPRGRSTSTTTTRRCARTSRPPRSSCRRYCTTSSWRAMQVHGALGVTNEMPFLPACVTGAA